MKSVLIIKKIPEKKLKKYDRPLPEFRRIVERHAVELLILTEIFIHTTAPGELSRVWHEMINPPYLVEKNSLFSKSVKLSQKSNSAKNVV